MTETEIQKSIVDYLKTIGITAWRQNSGKTKYNVYMAPAGTPDIIGYFPNGKFLGIEVKQPKGKLSNKQKEWHEKAEKSGCVILTAYSLSDVVDYITKELGGIE